MAVHRPFGLNCQNRLFANSVIKFYQTQVFSRFFSSSDSYLINEKMTLSINHANLDQFFKLLTKSLLSSIITENFKAAPFP